MDRKKMIEKILVLVGRQPVEGRPYPELPVAPGNSDLSFDYNSARFYFNEYGQVVFEGEFMQNGSRLNQDFRYALGLKELEEAEIDISELLTNKREEVVRALDALETAENFQDAHAIAQQFVRDDVDPRTVGKVMTYLREHDPETFWRFLHTVVEEWHHVVQSLREQDDYRHILSSCEEHLPKNDKEAMLFVFGWAKRLQLFYRVCPKYIPPIVLAEKVFYLAGQRLEAGDFVEGIVTKIRPFGLFVDIGLDRQCCLVHISEVFYGYMDTMIFQESFVIGQMVLAKVKSISKGSIFLTMKGIEQPVSVDHDGWTVEKMGEMTRQVWRVKFGWFAGYPVSRPTSVFLRSMRGHCPGALEAISRELETKKVYSLGLGVKLAIRGGKICLCKEKEVQGG